MARAASAWRAALCRGAEGGFDGGDACGAEAEVIDAETDEEAGGGGIGGGFAADADVFAVPMGGGGDLADGAEDGGVEGVLETREGGVAAVGGEEVLGEVVGADAEEIGVGGELIDEEDGGGNLDHDASGDGPGVWCAGGIEHAVCGLDRGAGFAQLGELGDHGEHDAEMAAGASTEDGAKLGLEEIGMTEAETEAAFAEEGIRFARVAEVGALPCRRRYRGCG